MFSKLLLLSCSFTSKLLEVFFFSISIQFINWKGVFFFSSDIDPFPLCLMTEPFSGVSRFCFDR